MNNKNKNKNVIITGCNGLIGLKLCQEISKKNINIFGIDFIDKKNISSDNFNFYNCDLTNENQVEKVIEEISKEVNNIDCLIHLAGIDYKVASKLKKNQLSLDHNSISSPKQVMQSINANIGMLYNIVYSLLPVFLKQKKSKIVLIGSVYGSVSPNPKLYIENDKKYFYQKPIEYTLSKSIFPSFAKYLCAHYSNQGLVINNLEPHAIINYPDKKFLENFKKLSPMERLCDVNEIVDLIIYLTISKCLYLNGETIKVDGGWSVL